MNIAFWIVFLILVIVLFMVLGHQKDKKEGFMSIDDYKNVERDQYIQMGRQRYNNLSAPIDIFRPGITRSLNESGVAALNSKINNALISNIIVPTRDFITNTTIEKSVVRDKFPSENNVLKEAKKCEAKQTRDSCAILSDPEYAKCGVCILGGTDSMEKRKGNHIGGMLVLEKDRRMAEKLASDTGGTAVYEPTTGSCPAGHLYVDRYKCEKAVNRQNCKEVGQTGGFLGGKTIEGKDVVGESCAYCPQSGEENLFLYEPKTRDFPIAIRVITPTGTGMNEVRIDGWNRETQRETVLASGQAIGGNEIYLNLSGQVSEGQDIKIRVIQQFPHIPRGKEELFHFHGYQYTKEQAANLCSSVGSRQATSEELRDGYNKGAQNCSYGWLADKDNAVGLVMQVAKMRNDLDGGKTNTDGWCGPPSQPGAKIDNLWIHEGKQLTKENAKFAAWCYGIKPKVGEYRAPDGTAIRVDPFFRSVGNRSVPSQEDKPSIASQYGDDYVAPNYRAVIIQWEMRTEADPAPRRAPIESSIVNVMGQNPNTVTTDGFKIFKILRRRGMFSSSVRNRNAMILSPNSSTNSSIIANQYWIWSNQNDNREFYFTAKVPGIFINPFYAEDTLLCPRGPIVGERSTLDLLKMSPCLKEGQRPGNYSIDCLKFLFQGAGGDIYNGELSPIKGDISRLMFKDNKALEQDDILEVLSELYSIATRGRNADGIIVSQNNKKERRRIINDAGMKMFGMEIVTPCEEVSESVTGDIVLQPKTAPFDAECLDYLFLNTSTDKSRGMEGLRNTTLSATYTSIGDRYSGLRLNEKDTPEAMEKFPFQTCQRAGLAAPMNEKGQVNMAAISAANAAALARSGSLRDAQNYFNGIFTKANMTVDGEGTSNMELVKEQEDAINKCFGIKKVIEPKRASGCGVMARFVRILRSLSGNAEHYWTAALNFNNRTYGAQIRLAQVEVFDEMNQEIAKNKPVMSGTNFSAETNPKNANQGKNWPRANEIYADSDNRNDASNYWMVDLGDFFEVRKVNVHISNFSNLNLKMVDALVQLLDADKKVIAHKVIGYNQIEKQGPRRNIATVSFGKADVTSPIQIGEIKPGVVLYLKSGVMNDQVLTARYVGYNTFSAAFASLDGGNANRKNMQLTVRAAISNLNGAISFTFQDKYFLFAHPLNNTHGHKGCYYMQMTQATSENYRKAASWIVRPALSGEPGWFSLQNIEYPNMYLAVLPQAGNWGLVMASPMQKDNISYEMVTCWRAYKNDILFNNM